jgi:hypothetical protein
MYCTAPGGRSCEAKVAEIGLALAEVLSNFMPAKKAAIKAVQVAKKSKDAGAGVFRQAVEALKSLIKDKVKELVKEGKRNLRKYMRKNGQQLREDLTEDILYGGAEALTAEMVKDMDEELKAYAIDIVEAVDPTGIAGAVRAFSAESCGDARIENMPLDGLDADRLTDDWMTWDCRISKSWPKTYKRHRGRMGLNECQDRCKDDFGAECAGVEWKRTNSCFTYKSDRDNIVPWPNACSDGWWLSLVCGVGSRC